MADGSPLPSAPSTPSAWLARELLVVTRHELDRADEKANTLFRLYGVVIAASVGVVASARLTVSTAAAVPLAGAGALALAAVGILGRSVAPRKRHDAKVPRATYFGDIVQHPTVEALGAAVSREADDLERWTLEQLHVTSRIVDERFALVRRAIVLMAGAVLLAIVGVAIDNA